jgi:HK97 family phage prohead protease
MELSQMTRLEPERRASGPFEMRQGEDSIRVVGHAAVFNHEADIGGFFRETIRPGAFAKAIARDDVPLLIEHQDLPLARTRSGTLELIEDDIGLRIESELDALDPDVKRIVPKMRRGDLDKMSFAFLPVRQEWDESGDIPLRILEEVRLFDVSIVTSPAYARTDIALRSLDEWRATKRQNQNFFAASLRARLGKKLDLKLRGV